MGEACSCRPRPTIKEAAVCVKSALALDGVMNTAANRCSLFLLNGDKNQRGRFETKPFFLSFGVDLSYLLEVDARFEEAVGQCVVGVGVEEGCLGAGRLLLCVCVHRGCTSGGVYVPCIYTHAR